MDRVMRYASTLRFPRLLAVTAALFVIDLFFSDMVPFVDEVLLGLISLLFASLRRRKGVTAHKNEDGGKL